MKHALLLSLLPFLAAHPLQAEAPRVAGRALDGWLADLEAEDATVRLLAVKTLGSFGAAALPRLVLLLGDEDPAARYWAADHLGNLGEEARSALPALEEARSGASQAVRMAIDYALSRIRPGRPSLEGLLEGVRVPHRSVACAAADFLGRIGPPARPALPVLEEVLRANTGRGDYHIRGAVRNALRLVRQDTALENHVRPKGGSYRPLDLGPLRPEGIPAPRPADQAALRPNILWISCEDISPNLGCYGDGYASTPHLDRLASQGVRYTRAFTPSGVCAVNRAGIVSGLHAVAYGAHHMRTSVPLPPGVEAFPRYLRRAGYFCTNRSKTDYQTPMDLSQVWDRQGSGHRDWRERRPGQPFFSVINLTITHESQIRHGDGRHADLVSLLDPSQVHDPDRASGHLPPFHPDTPEARRDWARYHDNISEMDRLAGGILARLEADGLAGSTVVFFWSDHGRGLPRGKRWIYDSGTRIPLIVRWPGRLAAGSVEGELASTQDLPPTVLSLAGVEPPGHMHGRILFGSGRQPAPPYLFFHRDRMDEALELMRSARDARYRYIRNYEPHRPYAQHLEYMDRMPTLVDLRRLHREGRLDPVQSLWFRPRKPLEELYDTQADPHETVNLAGLPGHRERLRAMRSALEAWQAEVGDLGLVPEPVLHQRLSGR